MKQQRRSPNQETGSILTVDFKKRLQKDFSPISTRFVGENVIEFYPFRQRFPSIYPPTRMRLDSANKLGFKNGYKLIFLNASMIKLAAS